MGLYSVWLMFGPLQCSFFIFRRLFWNSIEQESDKLSFQHHEQPNVLGINNEFLRLFIKVRF